MKRFASADESAVGAAGVRKPAVSLALAEAAQRLGQGDVANAERITRDVLRKDPADVAALNLLASIALNVRQFDDAIRILERCLELSPQFEHARLNYALALSHSQRFDEALGQMDRLLANTPDSPQFRFVKATIHTQQGDHPAALAMYEALVESYPDHVAARINMGHAMAAVGRIDGSYVTRAA